MRPVTASMRGQRIGEWRTDSAGRCTYHSDGKRTATASSLADYVIGQLYKRMGGLQRMNEVYDAKFRRNDTIRVRLPQGMTYEERHGSSLDRA